MVPGFGFVSEIIPVFSRKVIFGYATLVAATVSIGAVAMSTWAHHMFTVGMGGHAEFVLRGFDHALRRPDRSEDLQLARHAVRGQATVRTPLPSAAPSCPVPLRRADRDHALGRPFDWQLSGLLFCRSHTSHFVLFGGLALARSSRRSTTGSRRRPAGC